jgi:hypothetical protein
MLRILLLCLLLQACSTEKDPVINPCERYVRPVPGFIVQDDLQQQCSNELGITYACDTIGYTSYRFTSLVTYDTYVWEVIGDPNFRRTTKSFELTFSNPLRIRMRLIGKRTPNKACDPSDDGVDTVIKTITVVADTAQDLLFGKYVGYDVSNPGVRVGMEIAHEIPPGYVNKMIVVKYFPDSCLHNDIGLLGSFSSSYNLLFVNNHNASGVFLLGCQQPRGWFMFTPDGVDIVYATRGVSAESAPVQRRFIGKRIK